MAANKKDTKTTKPKAVVKKANTTSEKLIDAVVKRLVGHTNVVYYNCETNTLNTNKHNGYEIYFTERDAMDVKEFKTLMEKESEFRQQYEFIAPVSMTISEEACGKSMCGERGIASSEYKKDGTAVAGNIIVRNKATGKYELYCKSWVAVNYYDKQEKAVSELGGAFTSIATVNSEFLEEIIAAHTKPAGKKPIDTKPVEKKPASVANLSRVTVVKNDKAPQIKPVVKRVATEKVTAISEKLTDAVVERLVGHTNVMYYNYETKALNRIDYDGSKIASVQEIQNRMDWAAFNTKKIPEFSAQYELVAFVIMTTDCDQYYNRFYPIEDTVYCRKGNMVAGNIIVKNKATGKYELYCNYWFCVGLYDHPNDKDRVAYLGMYDIECAVSDSYNCAAVQAMHTRPLAKKDDRYSFLRELDFYDALFPQCTY